MWIQKSAPPANVHASSARADVAEGATTAATASSFGPPGAPAWRAFSQPSARVTASPTTSAETDALVETAFQDLLGRSGGTGGFWHEFAAQKRSEGMPLQEIDAEVRRHVKGSEEYRALHATDEIVDGAFRDVLGRDSGGAGFWHEFAKQKHAEGMSYDEIDREVRAHLAASEEYALAHPTPVSSIVRRGGPGSDLVPDQLALGGAVGWAACGPAALVALERARGNDELSLPGAVDVARNFGWNIGGGMNGFANFERMARARGLDFQTGTTADIQAQVEAGNPVVISTPAHYFVAQAYDPASGKYFVGKSGTVMAGGSQWLSLSQMEALAGRTNGVGWAR